MPLRYRTCQVRFDQDPVEVFAEGHLRIHEFLDLFAGGSSQSSYLVHRDPIVELMAENG